jgi:signal transduction histidine kinase
MNQGRILVIDDEMGIREGCRRALRPQGFTVETAEDGDEALRIIRSVPIDLALIDVMMPGISGVDLITRIHEYDPEIICIIITGYATVELAVQTIKRGAYDFLTKPFTVDDLLLAVNQGLERRRLSLESIRLKDIEEEAHRLAEEKARLEALDEAKIAFIRLVTHELQAPISAISTYLDLILNDYVPPEEQREILERAQERAKEQIDLITDLLEFGKLKEVQSRGKPELIQVEAVLDCVLQELGPQAKDKDIELSTEIVSDNPPVYMVPDQLKSVWTNLITNALKYTMPGGTVQVGLKTEEAAVLGWVEDTGIGIPEEAKANLFTEFFRARNAKALNIPGTGLGLAIVKQILENVGGNIKVDSAIGTGSTFTFSIPSAEAPADPHLTSPGELTNLLPA